MSEDALIAGGDLASDSFVGLLDLKGTLLQANRPASIGQPIWQTQWWPATPESVTQVKRALQEAARGQAVLYEMDVHGKPVDFSLAPLLDNDGRISFLMVKAALARKAFTAKSAGTVDSRAVFKRALNNLSGVISSSNAAVQIENLPKVRIGESHLLQVFQNIVDNAIKFRGYWPPYIKARGRSEGGFCEFSIEDNGIGIDSQYSERIFQASDGEGVGLSTCRRIVERYGGRIWVQSELDQGATFYFTVPSGHD